MADLTDPLRQALTTALVESSVYDMWDSDTDYSDENYADALIAAMPTVKAVVDTAVALARFMRAPDTNEDGTPADWTPGLDIIGEFYAAVDDLLAEEK
jgi:hypothetical protein